VLDVGSAPDAKVVAAPLQGVVVPQSPNETRQISMDTLAFDLPADNYEEYLNTPLPTDFLVMQRARNYTKGLSDPFPGEDLSKLWNPLVLRSKERYFSALRSRPESAKRVAIIMVGDFRTLAEPEARMLFREHLFQPLLRSGYSYHLFALLRPLVSYSCDSPFARFIFKGWGPKSSCHQSESRHFQGKDWTPEKFLVPLVAAVHTLSDMMEGTGDVQSNLTYQGLDVNCCVKFKSIQESDATMWNKHRCGYLPLFSQFYAASIAYSMLRAYEAKHNITFGYIIKVRPDSAPTVDVTMSTQGKLYVDRNESDLTSSANHRYCNWSDGEWMLPRYFGDVFFTTYRSYDDCFTASEEFGHDRRYPDSLFHTHQSRYGLTGSERIHGCQKHFRHRAIRPTDM